MKPQNFYHFLLEEHSICAENILTYCEEIKELEEGLLQYFQEEEKTSRRLHVNMKILGASSKKEMSNKKNQEIEKKKKIIENISKFISFMEKEDKEYSRISNSSEFQDWLDREQSFEENYFEPINCIPAYIHKHSGVMVLDLLETFGHIMRLIQTDIECIIETSLPTNRDEKLLTLVPEILHKNNIKIDEETSFNLTSLVLTYEDFMELTSLIRKEIKELEEPVKL